MDGQRLSAECIHGVRCGGPAQLGFAELVQSLRTSCNCLVVNLYLYERAMVPVRKETSELYRYHRALESFVD
jgi:hypothetical protein